MYIWFRGHKSYIQILQLLRCVCTFGVSANGSCIRFFNIDSLNIELFMV